MLTRAATALALIVRLYDAYGFDPGELSSARRTADAILSEAGVVTTWRGSPCDDALAPTEIIVRIVAAPLTSEADALGFSFVDPTRQAGWLATVFGDRVKALSAVADANPGQLLGRVMAHEIGHLLLGTARHGERGLMRPRWTTLELRENQPSNWVLTADEATRMRQAIARRAREAQRPDAEAARRADRFAGGPGKPRG